MNRRSYPIIFDKSWNLFTFFLNNTYFKIYKCHLLCRKTAHYHCCYCDKTVISWTNFTKHLLITFFFILFQKKKNALHSLKPMGRKETELAYESKIFDMKQNTYTMLGFKLCNYNIGQLILNYLILADQTPVVPSVFSKVWIINFNDDLKCVSCVS